MAETTARQFIFSALIFGAIITGCFILIANSLPDSAQKSELEKYNTTLNKFADLQEQSEKVNDKIESGEPRSGALGMINGLIESSWGSLRLIFGSVSTFSSILSSLSNQLGVPVWFTGLLISIITTTVAFALMAAWFKWHI